MSAEDFARSFAAGWIARDAAALAALMTEDADMLSLTGAWSEGRGAITATLRGELQGLFARARLVTGRSKLRMLGTDRAVLHQRFVLSGLRGPEGQDMGRVGALLIAVLEQRPEGWRAVALQFTATEG